MNLLVYFFLFALFFGYCGVLFFSLLKAKLLCGTNRHLVIGVLSGLFGYFLFFNSEVAATFIISNGGRELTVAVGLLLQHACILFTVLLCSRVVVSFGGFSFRSRPLVVIGFVFWLTVVRIIVLYLYDFVLAAKAANDFNLSHAYLGGGVFNDLVYKRSYNKLRHLFLPEDCGKLVSLVISDQTLPFYKLNDAGFLYDLKATVYRLLMDRNFNAATDYIRLCVIDLKDQIDTFSSTKVVKPVLGAKIIPYVLGVFFVVLFVFGRYSGIL